MRKLFIIGFSVFLLVSCFDSENENVVSQEDKEESEVNVEDAKSALSDVIYNMAQNNNQLKGPNDIPKQTDVSAAHGLFDAALKNNPHNKNAHLGIALTNIMMITQTDKMDTLFNKWQNILDNQEQTIAKKTSLTMNKSLSFSPNSSCLKEDQIIKTYLGVSKTAYQEPIKLSEIQNLIEVELIPRLEESITHLEKIVDDSSYTFMVPPKMQGNLEEDTLELDLTEVHALKAGLHSLHALSQITIAYNINAPTNPNAEKIKSLLSQDSDFLTLRKGTDPMKTARSSILKGTEALSQGIDNMIKETDNQDDDIITKNDFTPEEIDSIEIGIEEVETHLQEEENYLIDLDNDGNNETMTINAKQIFEDPVQDLKKKLPAYTIEIIDTTVQVYNDDYEEETVTQKMLIMKWKADSYQNWTFPDPTINKALPNMTNNKLKKLLEINEESWSKEVPLTILRQ